MSKERYNQIITEVGQKYTKWWYANAIPSSNGKPKLNGESILTRGEFINKIKTDSEFSERWGLKIEERELSWKERVEIARKTLSKEEFFEYGNLSPFTTPIITYWLNQNNIPTKLLTVIYNNETIESYE